MLLNIGLGSLVVLNGGLAFLNGFEGNWLGFSLAIGSALLSVFALAYRIEVHKEQRKFQRLFEERAKE